jgi:hypothetical protein
MTFAALAKADLDDAPKLDGINVWPTLLDPTRPHRTEVLISDKILGVRCSTQKYSRPLHTTPKKFSPRQSQKRQSLATYCDTHS